MRKAIYPGSFDPFTLGHLDLIHRALHLFDEVIVAVAVNANKQSLFTLEERQVMIAEVLKDTPQVQVLAFDGLLVDFAKQHQACALVRGLRAVSDFEWEFQLALMNRHLDEQLETIFLMPNAEFTYLSSSMVKEVARLQGDVSRFLPPSIHAKLQQKFQH